ncbi:flavin reductase family protein [Aeromicrobium sp. Root236]|uniref:flavin reductase family protein n=1 Tax=Aeromicrobium sp. Root236 TaxID=1736498 RepID=UPI000A9C4D61|nr:flavin reductase family protein [Aeromicrobium sp. Root236]
MTDADLPEGMSPDAAVTWPSRELIDSYLGGHDEMFAWRPGEVVHIDGEAAQAAARTYRDVLGQYASGVTVVTTLMGDVPVGMTCQSFTSVSLDPPLVAFLPMKTSRAFAAIRMTRQFCVNFLAAEQAEVSNGFASRDEDKFAGVDWEPTDSGMPRLKGIVGWVDCVVQDVHEAGDHYLVIGRVEDLGHGDGDKPLLFHRGRYRTAESGE